jgi:hypothetical protein
VKRLPFPRLPCEAVTVHILHLNVDINQFLSKFCVNCKTILGMEIYELDISPDIRFSGPSTSITNSVYEMYIGIFLKRKCERHLSDIFAQ